MRIIFAGTPAFAASQLQSLLEQPDFDIVAIYTQPDRRAGRGKKTLPPPVKQLALEHNLPVYQPTTLRDDDNVAELAALNADIMVVAAYGMILPQAVLDLPRLGCVNVHASLLPRWRGAAPIERAIIEGDSETGVTIMQMDAGLDTGAMLKIGSCTIDANETGDSLRDKLATLGAPLLVDTLRELQGGTCTATAQDDALANYANKLDKTEAEIDWSEPAALIERKLRAFTSALATHTYISEQRLRLFAPAKIIAGNATPGSIASIDGHSVCIGCADKLLQFSQLQIPGSKPMSVQALLNGRPELFAVGQTLGRQAPV